MKNRCFVALAGFVVFVCLFMPCVHAIEPTLALFDAIEAEDLEQVRKLVSAGADVNMPHMYLYNVTPLMLAARSSSSVELIEVLIDAGADLNFDSVSGTPLAYASTNSKSNYDIFGILLRRVPIHMVMIKGLDY